MAKIAGINFVNLLGGNMILMLYPLCQQIYMAWDNYHIKNSHVMASLIKKFCDAKKNNEKK